MCGIIGIFGSSDVVEELRLGLIAIQHRGQDTAGIITYEHDKFHSKKGKGLVQEVFTPEDLRTFKGNLGIGHVRYPTIGEGSLEDAQPFSTNSPFGIAMAHNGNVINYAELKEWLIHERHRHINTSCDVEVILNIFASALERPYLKPTVPPIFEAIKEVMDKVNGSYSCVCLIAGYGFLAFRDPHGIKPLVFGCKGKDFCFASESVALDTLGYKDIRDVKPGEAIFIDSKKNITSKIIKAKQKPQHCIFEYIYFARPDSMLDGVEVYTARVRLGEELGKLIKSKNIIPDVVIPIPDTARPASMGAANMLGVPYREGLIKNRYIGRTFIMPKDVKRKEMVKYKLNPVKSEIEGKRVLLVDDSIVRGSTSEAIISLVRGANAKEVYFASTCPPLKHPCFYGIDMQTRQEFIARDKSIAQIQKEIKADKLIYQTLDGMLSAIGNCHCEPSPCHCETKAKQSQQDSYCTACFTGDYPTKVNLKDIKRIEKERTGSEQPDNIGETLPLWKNTKH